MALQVNRHVTRLNGYLPFDAEYDQLFYEYSDDEQIALPTRALDGLWDRASSDRTLRLIVLTGDAGHGKTHIAAQILMRAGIASEEANRLLNEHGNGRTDLCVLPSGLNLRVIKDLSELQPVTEAADLLVQALANEEELLLVCANEGRLRSAAGEVGESLGFLREALDRSVEAGALSSDERLLLLNLNFQSVAARGERDSLVDGLLRNWVADKRRWGICGTCDAQPGCPVYENHRQLADGELGERRRDGFEVLFRTAERIGAVITIRELLILTAYAITGGLECEDVHARHARRDWQPGYVFSENLFGERLSSTQARSVRSLRQLRLLDPGRVALREVDDHLHPDSNERVGIFVPAEAKRRDQAPVTRREAARQAARLRDLFRFMRRRDYFSRVQSDAESLARMGFRHASDFEALVAGGLPDAEFRRVRDTALAGLEAVQGIRRTAGAGNFILVDPAFAGGAAASIVARRLGSNRIEIRSQSRFWVSTRERSSPKSSDLSTALDWTDRAVIIDFGEEGGNPVYLDLLSFEFVMRSAQGLNAREFFDGDVRRINAELAPLAARTSDEEGRISVVRDGRVENLVIDKGSVIRSVEG